MPRDTAARTEPRTPPTRRVGPSLRARLLLVEAGLLAAVVLAVLLGMELVLRREVVGRLEASLEDAAAAVRSSLRDSLERLAREARVVSAEPRLRAVASASGLDPATRDDVVGELRVAIGWDFLALATPDGELLSIAGAAAPSTLPPSPEPAPEIGKGYWLVGGRLFAAVTAPLAFGDRLAGVLAGGVQVTDASARDLVRASRAAVAFFDRDGLVASSASQPLRAALAELRRPLPREARLGGEEFLLREVDFGGGDAWAVALQSRREALEPYLRLRRSVLAVGAVALLAAIGLAALVGRGLARHVGRLVDLARAVREGRLEVRAQASGGKELAELGDRLNEMVEEIAQQRRRDELASFLVHDLKNPLTGVLLQARMLAADESLPAEARASAADVVSGAEAVLGMVVDLLDVSRSVDGKLVADRADLEVAVLLEDVRRGAAARAAEREQRIAVAPGGPARLRADPELLRRVLDNLVDNSLKYAPAGGSVTLECRAPEPGAVELWVRDEGPGVPVALRERIFDKYFRLERDASTQARTSRGLGLVFCRAAVEAHGGRIWVEDNLPRGTAFGVRLPAG